METITLLRITSSFLHICTNNTKNQVIEWVNEYFNGYRLCDDKYTRATECSEKLGYMHYLFEK